MAVPRSLNLGIGWDLGGLLLLFHVTFEEIETQILKITCLRPYIVDGRATNESISSKSSILLTVHFFSLI